MRGIMENRFVKCLIIIFAIIAPFSLISVNCEIAIRHFIGGLFGKKQPPMSEIFKYVNKYKYAINNDLPKNLYPDDNYKNCIWSCWLQGEENASGIVKTCLKSIRKHSDGRPVIVIDETSYSKYVQLPKHILDKYKRKIIPPALFSDIIRYCLLYKYGGTWLDATVLLLEKLPSDIIDRDFFMFSLGGDEKTCLLTNNWLIHTKPGNPIIKDLINLSFEYWKKENHLVNYFLSYLFFKVSVDNNEKSGGIYKNMPKIEYTGQFGEVINPYSEQGLIEFLQPSPYAIKKLMTGPQRIFVGNSNLIFWDHKSSLLYFFDRNDALEEIDRILRQHKQRN